MLSEHKTPPARQQRQTHGEMSDLQPQIKRQRRLPLSVSYSSTLPMHADTDVALGGSTESLPSRDLVTPSAAHHSTSVQARVSPGAHSTKIPASSIPLNPPVRAGTTSFIPHQRPLNHVASSSTADFWRGILAMLPEEYVTPPATPPTHLSIPSAYQGPPALAPAPQTPVAAGSDMDWLDYADV